MSANNSDAGPTSLANIAPANDSQMPASKKRRSGGLSNDFESSPDNGATQNGNNMSATDALVALQHGQVFVTDEDDSEDDRNDKIISSSEED